MSTKISNSFLALVFTQALHSIEEYIGELWNVFPPAVWLTSIISEDHHFGFVVINSALFVFGLFCWFFLVRVKHKYAKFVLGFWLAIEVMNGIAHPIWSFMKKGYSPGLITAPVLLVISIYLIKVIYDDKVHFLK